MSKMSQKVVDEQEIDEKFTNFHPRYLVSLAGILRLVNIALGITLICLWIPGYEHDYLNPSKIVNFRDTIKHWGAGIKSETLNQFALANIIICLLISCVLLIALIVVSHAYVDWNRMNKITHLGLAAFHGIGTICGAVGIWYFQENCCRVDLEWYGLGFRYKPAIHQFGYPRNNMHCHCWLTRRESETETETQYTTALWEPHNYPDKYAGEEASFVSFAAHDIHIHAAAVVLMLLNTLVYAFGSFFSKIQSSTPITPIQ